MLRNNKEAQQTGGGSCVVEPIRDIEENILDVIKKVSVEGHNVPETAVEFELEEECEDLGIITLLSRPIGDTPEVITVLSENDVRILYFVNLHR